MKKNKHYSVDVVTRCPVKGKPLVEVVVQKLGFTAQVSGRMAA